MTYCLAMRLDAGLIFLSDTRTNAGVDNVGTYRKLHVLHAGDDRVFVLQSAGSLATTHEVLSRIDRDLSDPGASQSLATVQHLFEAALYVGPAEQGGVRRAQADRRPRRGGDVHPRRPDPPASGRTSLLVYPEGNYIRVVRHRAVPADRRDQVRQVPARARRAGPRRPADGGQDRPRLDAQHGPRQPRRSGPPYDAGLYRNGTFEVRELRIEEDNAYLRQLNEVWIEQLLDSIAKLPPIPSEVLDEFD